MENFELLITESPVKKAKKSGGKILLLLFLSPVILVFAVAIGISLLFSFVFRKLFGKKEKVSKAAPAFNLIKNDTVCISLHDIEDKHERLLDEWCDMTNNEAECLFLAKTQPVIRGIHDEFVTSFIKEYHNGVLLQRLIVPTDPASDPMSSELIWVDYEDLAIKEKRMVGRYFLYEDKRDSHLIRGFNQKMEVQIELKDL